MRVHAQQSSMPLIGYLNIASPDSDAYLATAFRRGLNEVGFVEGRNVTIEFRWAEGKVDRLPALAADLVSRHVTIIVAGANASALAAKAATSTIPIVFSIGSDPVTMDLLTALNRPGANVTGITFFAAELDPKRLLNQSAE